MKNIKKCTICKEDKRLSCFHRKTKTSRHSACIECSNRKQRERYAKDPRPYCERVDKARIKIRNFINNIKSGPCADCGARYHPCVMDFDHVYGEKKYNVSSLIRMLSDEDIIMEEINKCELVCSNCHRIRTFNRLKKTKK